MMMMMMMFPKYNQNKTQLKILQKQFFNITLAELRLKSGQKKGTKNHFVKDGITFLHRVIRLTPTIYFTKFLVYGSIFMWKSKRHFNEIYHFL